MRILLSLLFRKERVTFNLLFLQNALTFVLCNRQPFSKNGIFPNLIEQKTNKMHFKTKMKIWKTNFFWPPCFGFCHLWSPKNPEHGGQKKFFFSNFYFCLKMHLFCFLFNKIWKNAIFWKWLSIAENTC